jgi:hypothetical protein
MPKRFTIHSGIRDRVAGSVPASASALDDAAKRGAMPTPDVKVIAARTLQSWEAITAALIPVIGQRGMAALYKRTLALCTIKFAWLPAFRDDTAIAMELSALHVALLHQQAPIAAAAGEAMQSTIVSLLGSLIGASLTAQLLQSAAVPERAPTSQPTLLP